MPDSNPVKTGWIDEPDTPEDDPLWQTIGYVTSVTAEQEGTRTAIRFDLLVYSFNGSPFGPKELDSTTVRCWIYLDKKTPVVMSQLQLLRDAMWSTRDEKSIAKPLPVHIHFNFRDDTQEWVYVYWLRLRLPAAGDPYPVTPASEFDAVRSWGYTRVTEAF